MDPGDQPVIEWVYKLLENIQSILKNGVPGIGLPPFDPIEMGSVHLVPVNNTSQFTDPSADLYSIVATGLSGLTIDTLDFHILNMSGALQLSLSELNSNGDFAAQATTTDQEDNASGHFDIQINDAILHASLAFDLNGTALQISELLIEAHYGVKVITLSNVAGNQDLANELQQKLDEYVDYRYDTINENLENLANEITDAINNLLASASEEDQQISLYMLYIKLQNILGIN